MSSTAGLLSPISCRDLIARSRTLCAGSRRNIARSRCRLRPLQGASDDTPPDPLAGDTTLAGRTVLVIEDHADSRDLLTQVLHELRAHVRTAGNLEEAEQQLATHHPDLIVCDMKLPDGTGLDFIARLRAMPAVSGGNIPCIAITGYQQYFAASRVGSAFDAYLQKPVDLDRFCDLVMALAQRRSGRARPR